MDKQVKISFIINRYNMEVDPPLPTDEKPKKKKKKFLGKLKIPEDHSNPTESDMGMGEETKAADSIQSTGSYQHVIVDREQIDIQDGLNKFAPQVRDNTITLKSKNAF